MTIELGHWACLNSGVKTNDSIPRTRLQLIVLLHSNPASPECSTPSGLSFRCHIGTRAVQMGQVGTGDQKVKTMQ